MLPDAAPIVHTLGVGCSVGGPRCRGDARTELPKAAVAGCGSG